MQELGESKLRQNVTELTTDGDNNNNSSVLKVMHPSGLSEKTDKNYNRGVETIQQNSSAMLLPPVSPSYIPVRTSKRDLINMVVSGHVLRCLTTKYSNG